MIYNDNKAQSAELKKYLKPQSPGKAHDKSLPDRKGPATNPLNRHLPIRGI